MRHGRKSSSGKFDGYKTHLTKDTSSDIITDIDVSPGNCPDADMAQPLIKEAKEEFGVKTRSLTGDGAFGSGKMQKEMSDEGIELIHHGLRKTRYRGVRKSRLQALFTGTAVNLKRVFKEQQAKKINFGIPEAIPALT